MIRSEKANANDTVTVKIASSYLHYKAWIVDIIVVSAVGVHQEDVEGELGQRYACIHIGM